MRGEHFRGKAGPAEKHLRFAIVLTAGVLVAEIAGGIWANSLALLSDAAHVFTDVFAIALSLFAIWLAKGPPTDTRTYGWHRTEIFAAFINGALLVMIGAAILRESITRFVSPEEVKGKGMLIIAVVGLAANAVVLLKLRKHDHEDLNVHSAFLHVAGDLLASVGVVAAGVIISFSGLYFVDPLVAGAIAVVIVAGALKLLRNSTHILLEGVPSHIKLDEVSSVIKETEGVKDVHHLHIWSICSHILALSSHILVDRKSPLPHDEIRENIKKVLAERFHISETTLEMDIVQDEGLIAPIAHAGEVTK